MKSVLAKGKSTEEALQITKDDIVNAFDGLLQDKIHCSVLGVKALSDTINNYLKLI